MQKDISIINLPFQLNLYTTVPSGISANTSPPVYLKIPVKLATVLAAFLEKDLMHLRQLT